MSENRNLQALAHLEPAEVWRLFAALSSIPRPSKGEARVREYVRALAQSRGLESRQDEAGNLVIEVPASPGREKAPVTVLQGHLDMVCEKNSGTEHDFDRDPIRLRVEGTGEEQVVAAEGTTLGADNGLGVALALAAAVTPGIVRGPLEILLTVDEEAGMTGAKELRSDFFRGRRMLNLDSEEDDRLYIGCAGGCDTTLRWQLPVRPLEGASEAARVEVRGLRGGHSGGDIHENRGSAVQVLLRALLGAEIRSPRLVEIGGGSKRNAIAREAAAVLAGPPGTAEALRRAALRAQEEAIRNEGEANCRVTATPAPPAAALVADDTARVLSALHALPHGVLSVVPEIPGLVRTSNNVATLRMEGGGGGASLEIACLSRSSSDFDLEQVVRRLASIGRLGDAVVESGNHYPGWQPDVSSPILASARRAYLRLFGAEPTVTAIHAGLECGIIGERVGGMDMVSLGPSIKGAHSPDERAYVASVGRSWRLLQELLKDLAG